MTISETVPSTPVEKPPESPAAVVHERSSSPSTAVRPDTRSMLEGARFSQKMLDIGFGAALVLASLCLLMSAWYLFRFLSATNTGIAALLENPSALSTDQTVLQLAINSRVVMTRFALLSCGVFVGMAFGFLGFALFLMGIKGEMDVSAQAESYTIKIARMSPGVSFFCAPPS